MPLHGHLQGGTRGGKWNDHIKWNIELNEKLRLAFVTFITFHVCRWRGTWIHVWKLFPCSRPFNKIIERFTKFVSFWFPWKIFQRRPTRLCFLVNTFHFLKVNHHTLVKIWVLTWQWLASTRGLIDLKRWVREDLHVSLISSAEYTNVLRWWYD